MFGVTGSWQHIWRMKIPPIVKNLLWRIGHNVLPTWNILNSHRINCSAHCYVRNDAAEDSLHVLFLILDRYCFLNNNNITDIVFSILDRLDIRLNKSSLALWCGVFGSVEIIKYGKILPKLLKRWENVTETVQTVYERARHLITSWQNAKNFQSLANITHSSSSDNGANQAWKDTSATSTHLFHIPTTWKLEYV
jgi:hypothetical protein